MMALVLLTAGCAQTQVTSDDYYLGPHVKRPGRILVHNFAASPADIPPGSKMIGRYAEPATPLTPQQLAVGRQLGAEVAKALVAEIQAMGLPAVLAAGQPGPQLGDLVLMGYFEAVDPGNVASRVMIGFGDGTTHLRTAVEGYLMTDTGLKRLATGEVDSDGDRTPGLALPIATAVATGNPIGLIVSSAIKVEGEATGRTTIEGAAKRTAQLIGQRLQAAFQRQRWI
jgi:hypothetical protein